MKYCRSCKHLTYGNPSYCNACGKSYNIRLCASQHVNPITASACAVCGSKELSLPQQAASAFSRGATMIAFVVGCVLLAASLFYLTKLLRALIANPEPPLPLMLVGLGLGLAWLLFAAPGSSSKRRRHRN